MPRLSIIMSFFFCFHCSTFSHTIFDSMQMSMHIQKCHIYKEQHTFYFRNGCLCTELYRLWFESFMMFESYICIWMTSIKSPRAISYIEVSSVLEDKEHCIIVFSQFELTLYYLLFYFLIYKICFFGNFGYYFRFCWGFIYQ